MTALVRILRELAGLFVDDGSLALAIVAVVVLAAAIASLIPGLLAGAVLVVGCLGVLLTNVMIAALRHRSRSAAQSARRQHP
jgi:hypothetical protein